MRTLPEPGPVLRLVVFALLVAFVACSEEDPGPPPPSPALSEAGLRGREVFLERTRPRCSHCHVLREAGATAGEDEGALGPDLDERRPSRKRTIRVVERGIGTMDPQADQLTEQELDDLAVYVEEATRLGG